MTTTREAVVRTVAHRSAAEMVRQLPDLSALDVAELRGYIRGRAAATVRRHARSVAAESDLPDTLPAQWIDTALERTVHHVVRQQLLRSHLPVIHRAAA